MKIQIVSVAALAALVSSCRLDPMAGEHSAANLKPKALVIMLDGMRADAVENAAAPNLRMLRDGKWQPGYRCAWSLAANTILDAPTISGPNHLAIATGVTGAKTHQRGNEKNKCDHGKWPSWLVRLVDAKPDKKALFMFSWKWDQSISPDPRVEFVHSTDAANADTMPRRLAAADAPDAIQWYIDWPDHGGHGFGYYPYTTGYLNTVHLSDKAIGDALKAIASRPTFAQEDWLIIVTADHGGYHRSHGMMNGPATTIPLLVCGRDVVQGRMPGTPHNFYVAPTVLTHFGVDWSKMGLDGKVAGKDPAAVDPVRPLNDGLAAYLPFESTNLENKVSGEVKAELCGKNAKIQSKGGFVERCLRIEGGTNDFGFVRLAGSEKLKFENGGEFALAFWMKMPKHLGGDPAILGNKNWERGINPGLAVVYKNGVMLNNGLPDNKRHDMKPYDVKFGEWMFYAVTRANDGVVRFYQGGQDGHLYWMAENAPRLAFATGLPFCIGSDGTGRYKDRFTGDIDDFALWTRTLSHDDVRRIYEAGRMGIPFGDLIK